MARLFYANNGPSDDHRQQQTSAQTTQGDDGFQHRPGFEGFDNAQVEVLLEQPETRIVDV